LSPFPETPHRRESLYFPRYFADFFIGTAVVIHPRDDFALCVAKLAEKALGAKLTTFLEGA
jgi:hypothetical protein